MRSVVQRVKKAAVRVDGEVVGQIRSGFLVLLGAGEKDTDADAAWMVEKIAGLRVFEDADGKMNLSLLDVNGEVLLVSQFTLYGDCRKGKRPSFSTAAPPEQARKLFVQVVEAMRAKGLTVETGVFQAHMEVTLVNDGPVTLLLDSEKKF